MTIADLNPKALNSITALEKALSEKTGEDISLIAYSPSTYADLETDAEAMTQISELEKKLSLDANNKIILMAFSI